MAINFSKLHTITERFSSVGERKTFKQDVDTETTLPQQIWTAKILLNIGEGLETKLFKIIKKDNELTNFMRHALQDALYKLVREIYYIKSWMKILE